MKEVKAPKVQSMSKIEKSKIIRKAREFGGKIWYEIYKSFKN